MIAAVKFPERRQRKTDRRSWRPDPNYQGPERRVACRRTSGWSTRLKRWVSGSEWVKLPKPFGKYEITLDGGLRHKTKDGGVVREWDTEQNGRKRSSFWVDGTRTVMRRAAVVLFVLAGKLSSQKDGVHAAHGMYGPLVDVPDNLRLSSVSENHRDKVRDGTSLAKLTITQVGECRERARAGETHETLATEFGVSRRTMTSAINGSHYPTCPTPPVPKQQRKSRVTPAMRREIVRLSKTCSQRAIGERLGLPYARINEILKYEAAHARN